MPPPQHPTTGRVGYLTGAEESALARFKETLKSEILEIDNSDERCLQWLRARSFDVKKAVSMYRDYASWRDDYDVSNALTHKEIPNFETIRAGWPQAWHGHDKLGRPIIIEQSGKFDVKALVQSGIGLEELIMFHIRQQEYTRMVLKEASERAGRRIEQIVTIMDIAGTSVGLSLNKHARQMFGKLATVDGSFYPESLGKMFIINAPGAFPLAWNFVKPFLDPATRDKIEICKGNGIDKLRELIDPDQLPQYLGGTCHCEGGCVPSNGKIDPSYHLKYSPMDEQAPSALPQVSALRLGSLSNALPNLQISPTPSPKASPRNLASNEGDRRFQKKLLRRFLQHRKSSTPNLEVYHPRSFEEAQRSEMASTADESALSDEVVNIAGRSSPESVSSKPRKFNLRSLSPFSNKNKSRESPTPFELNQ